MRFHLFVVACVFICHRASAVSDEKSKEEVFKPCTIRSPTTGSFFDLNPLNVSPIKDGKKEGKKLGDDDRTESWHARGYDYGSNFTLNFCGPVVEDLVDVVGVDKSLWRNISAFYRVGARTYSIGQENQEPVVRGRKLVLNYTGGSPCPDRRALLPRTTELLQDRAITGHDDHDDSKNEIAKAPQRGIDKDDSKDDDDNDRDKKRPPTKPDATRRKSTIISLLCEHDPLAPKVSVSFVHCDDQCTYFFEARSAAACPSVNVAKQTLGPSGVFGVIAAVAILVYVIGGVAYQRVVLHQRGLRQMPNYALWAGILGFFNDMFIILTSSCARFLPGRRGYGRVPSNGRPRGRSGGSDDENRLIDQLDEEWDD